MKKALIMTLMSNQRGVSAILVAICIFVLIGFGALAVDIGHLCVARNELKNAADAGSLRGARVLYECDEEGKVIGINEGANQEAHDTAEQNRSEQNPVEVNWTGGNEGDVQRGHWSFATRTFTPNDSLSPTELWNVSTADLDADTDYINAVRVTARRQATPIASYLATIFGHESFESAANATAWRGYAGKLPPGAVDQPIAICKDSLLNENNEYSCNVGRMLNSGTDEATNETGGWTSFNQDDPCLGGTNADELKSLVCADGNPETIFYGQPMATTGGVIDSVFSLLVDCWADNTSKIRLWPLTLPVIDCGDQNNVGVCQELVGAVEVNVVWITESGTDPHYKEAPKQMEAPDPMEDWVCPGECNCTEPDPEPDCGKCCWDDFVAYFNLKNANGDDAQYLPKCIYFLPDCDFHEPEGSSGGENFGIPAKYPKLVD